MRSQYRHQFSTANTGEIYTRLGVKWKKNFTNHFLLRIMFCCSRVFHKRYCAVVNVLCGNDVIYLLNGGTSFSVSFIKFSGAVRFFSRGLKRRFLSALARDCAYDKVSLLVQILKDYIYLFFYNIGIS